MTTMTATPRRTGRRAAPWAAITLAVVAAAGCSGGDGTVSASQAADTMTTSTVPATTTTAAADPSTTPASTVPVDGAALLQQSLDAIAGGYHFSTRVTVDGSDLLVAEGDRVADGTRLTIWADGGSVAYVITPGGSWVIPEGGDWEVLEAPPATTDPIGALRAPASVAVASNDGTTVLLNVTVPAVALGVPGDGTAEVVLAVAGTTLTEITYRTTVEGKQAEVRSTLSPLTDTSPVVAPMI